MSSTDKLGSYIQKLMTTVIDNKEDEFVKELALTELIAYDDLRTYILNNEISSRTAIIASYALCGFANFGSIGIQIGGLGSIAPKRRKDLARLAFKAMIGGALASWLTATIAGILI